MSVTRHIENNVGYVALDNPPVNAIGQPMRQGMLDAVRWAEAEMLDRVIVTGVGRAFAAGADAKEFDHGPLEPHLPDVMNAIDESFVPWVAAVNGIALGGGAEIALACRMRVMAPGAQIGLPEVGLGVIPGAGGTVRLPRLIGLAKALDMMAFGKPIGAAEALEIGLVHQVDEDPVEAAFMINTEELGCVVPTWELPAPAPDEAVFDAARAAVAKRSRGQAAPLRVIDVVEQGLGLPFHDALKNERQSFMDLKNGAQSAAMRHMFFAERANKPPKDLGAPAALDHVAVVGGGTMGAGIAYALLMAGIRVTLIETDEDAVARARANVASIVEVGQKRGKLSAAKAEQLEAALTLTSDYADAATATLAIEAAFEDMDVKKDIFGKLEAALPADAILASNTSYLDINEMAQNLKDPARLLGLHFFAPAHIMRLLEIVKGDASSNAAIATGYALAKKLRKIPVLAGVCDGFIGNRIYARYREAVDTVFMDGSTPWEIDEAMVDFGYAMGPYETQDLSGLDIGYAVRRRQDATRDPNRRYIPLADRMYELGKLGKKVGAGWYRYPGGGGKVEDPIVADLALEEAHFAGIERTEYEADEIQTRALMAMINEAADVLAEGIAQSARDIDLVTVFGYGFPRWRGGLMHYADTIGAKAIVAKLEELCKEDPVAWKISPVLLKCAKDGTKLADIRAG